MNAMARILPIIVIVSAALVFAVLLAHNLNHSAYYTSTMHSILYHYALPGWLTAGVLALLALNHQARLSAALSLAAIVPALYLAEGYFAYQRTAAKERTAIGAGAELDRRPKIRVIEDLRAQGIDAMPVMRAKAMLTEQANDTLIPVLGVGDTALLPLASLPGTTVVSCNESGRWLVYQSDRHGFNNDDAVWNASPPDVALLGDSFAHGSCVARDKNIASHLSSRLGTVVNLGVSGFGPVSELAALKEYAAPLRPPVVVWAVFEGNDVTEDTALERRAPMLMRYLDDPAFSQGLIGRASEISQRMGAYLGAEMIAAMERVDNPLEKIMDILQLFHLRERLGISPVTLGVIDDDPNRGLQLLSDVLVQARAAVDGWGGRLYVAYLPESARYFGSSTDDTLQDHILKSTRAIALGAGATFINVKQAFDGAADPRQFFFYPGSHYNEAGYRFAAETILAAIAANR